MIERARAALHLWGGLPPAGASTVQQQLLLSLFSLSPGVQAHSNGQHPTAGTTGTKGRWTGRKGGLEAPLLLVSLAAAAA